ncbi:hypothetical protein ACIBQ3_11540 [Streptomyces rubiginosohelvolus]|uniref:hypothetical protein n=1 Tax=Streptomyces rubiginosohelvolus TaxID=67362 RepID=UPI0037AFDBA1
MEGIDHAPTAHPPYSPQRVGQVAVEPSADVAATGLTALVDALGMQMLSRQYPEEDEVAALDAHLDLIFDADHATRQ